MWGNESRRRVIALGAVLMACEPAIEVHGNLIPGVNPSENEMQQSSEFDSTAIPGPLAESLCPGPRPPDDPEVFIAGGQQLMHGRASLLGTAGSMTRWCRDTCADVLPVSDEPPFNCGLVGGLSRHSESTDNNIRALPNGRVINVNLGSRNDCVAGTPQAVESSLIIRWSDDCGTSWSVTTLEASDVAGPDGAPLGVTKLDRQELHVDEDSDSVFLLFQVGTAPLVNRTVLVRGAASTAGTPTFQTIAVIPQPEYATAWRMASMPSDGGSGRLYFFGCQDGDDRPVLRFVNNPTAPGLAAVQKVDILSSLPAIFSDQVCAVVNSGSQTNPTGNEPGDLLNRIVSPAIVPISTTQTGPFRSDVLRVAYPDVLPGPGFELFQIARLIDVQVFTAGGVLVAAPADQVRVLSEADSGAHVLWPDLIGTNHFLNSTLADDVFAHALRFTTVTGFGPDTTVTESVDTWTPVGEYRGVDELDQYDMTPTADTPCGSGGLEGTAPCFVGDYHYGTFLDDAVAGPRNNEVRFLAPWVRPDASVAPRSIILYAATVTQP